MFLKTMLFLKIAKIYAADQQKYFPVYERKIL